MDPNITSFLLNVAADVLFRFVEAGAARARTQLMGDSSCQALEATMQELAKRYGEYDVLGLPGLRLFFERERVSAELEKFRTGRGLIDLAVLEKEFEGQFALDEEHFTACLGRRFLQDFVETFRDKLSQGAILSYLEHMRVALEQQSQVGQENQYLLRQVVAALDLPAAAHVDGDSTRHVIGTSAPVIPGLPGLPGLEIDWEPYLQQICAEQQERTSLYVELDAVPLDASHSRDEQQLVALIEELEDNVVIIGGPGSGKTTAMYRLVFVCARHWLTDRRGFIPVIVEMSAYRPENASSRPLDTLLFLILSSLRGLVRSTDELATLLQRGGFIVIFDGINEVEQKHCRESVSALQDFVHYYPGNRAIFTARTRAYAPDVPVTRLHIQDLSDDASIRFIEVYLSLPHVSAKDLWTNWGRALSGLAVTPLLVQAALTVYQANGDIPSSRGNLFEQYFQRLLREWECQVTKRERSGTVDSYPKFRVLAYLAFYMTGNALTAISPDLAIEQIGRCLLQMEAEKITDGNCTALDVRNELVNNGILDFSYDALVFKIQPYQEFFAAWELRRRLGEGSADYLSLIAKQEWAEPFVYLSGLLQNSSTLVEAALACSNPTLAARCYASARHTVVDLEDRIVVALAKAAREQLAYDQYRDAIEALAHLDTVTAVNALLDLLFEAGSGITTWCIIDQLEFLLPTHRHRIERRVLSVLASGRPGYVGTALDAVKRLNLTSAFDLLLDLVRRSGDSSDKREALEALVELGDERAKPVFLEFAANKENWFCRDMAIRGLGRLKCKEQVPLLIGLIGDAMVGDAAVQALAEIGERDAVPRIVEAALSHPCRLSDYTISSALGQLGIDDAIAPIRQALVDADRTRRGRATMLAGALRIDALVEDLSDLAAGISTEDRFAVYKSLYEITRNSHHIVAALNDTDLLVRGAAANFCGSHEMNSFDAQADTPLWQALLRLAQEDPEREVRINAALALDRYRLLQCVSHQADPVIMHVVETEDFTGLPVDIVRRACNVVRRLTPTPGHTGTLYSLSEGFVILARLIEQYYCQKSQAILRKTAHAGAPHDDPYLPCEMSRQVLTDIYQAAVYGYSPRLDRSDTDTFTVFDLEEAANCQLSPHLAEAIDGLERLGAAFLRNQSYWLRNTMQVLETLALLCTAKNADNEYRDAALRLLTIHHNLFWNYATHLYGFFTKKETFSTYFAYRTQELRRFGESFLPLIGHRPPAVSELATHAISAINESVDRAIIIVGTPSKIRS